ncbi:MAG: TonB-dependent receptor [Gemmatimonadota bacterium]
MRRLLGGVAAGVLSIACLTAGATAQAQQTGIVRGRVRDQSNEPVVGARVFLLGGARVAYSGADGSFALTAVPPARYVLAVQRLGFSRFESDSFDVAAGAEVERDVQLQAVHTPLSRVVISPGSYTLLEPTRTSQQVLSREQLLTRPQLAEDLFRSLNRLPGLSGSDFSSKLRIRNGGQDELLVLLDGMELVEPFHLKDFDGALSILDAEVIGRVEVKTGGFGVQYGNRLTGVIDLASDNAETSRDLRTSLGISFSNVRARTEGRFAGDRGAWLASARRGYLDIVLKLVGEEDAPDPRYYDLFAKVQYQLNSRHLLSGHVLFAGDELVYTEDDDATRAQTRYDNVYSWATLRSQVGDRLTITTLASLSHLTWDRDGKVSEFFQGQPYERTRVLDDRRLDAWGLKQDWTFDATERFSVLLGAELRREAADFDYYRVIRDRGFSQQTVVLVDTQFVEAALAPSGSRYSGYAGFRAQPWNRLTGEVGLRADRHTWTRQTTLSPRASASFSVTPRTTLRAAIGSYTQAHALHDLAVVDGETTFVRAERAQHRVVGVEYTVGAGWTLRSEAFERVIDNPRPRWINTDGELDALPETEEDRLRLTPSDGRVRGIEWLATYDRGGRVRAGVSYVLSKATATQNGATTPRPFDERHAVALDLTTRSASGWTWAFAWTMHSGWPFVPATFRVDTISATQVFLRRVPSEPLFSEELDLYQRFDVRVSRAFDVGRGRISVFAEIFNLLDTANHRGTSYAPRFDGRTLSVTRFRETFLPRLPSLGVRWDF